MSKLPNFFRFLTESAESTDCPVEVECLNGTKYCWIYEIIDEVYEKLEALKRGSCTPGDLVKNQVVMYEIIMVIICIIDNCCDPDPPSSSSSPSSSDPPQKYNCELTRAGLRCFQDDNGPYDSVAECQAAIDSGECGEHQPWLCDETTGDCIQHTSGTYATWAECDAAGCSREPPGKRWDCNEYNGRCEETLFGRFASQAECKAAWPNGCKPVRYNCEKGSDGKYTCVEAENGFFSHLQFCEDAIRLNRVPCYEDESTTSWNCNETNPASPFCEEVDGGGGTYENQQKCLDAITAGDCGGVNWYCDPDGKVCRQKVGGPYKSKGDCEDAIKAGTADCVDPDDDDTECCPQGFPGNRLLCKIQYAGASATFPVEYNEALGCWLPNRLADCPDMRINPKPINGKCCFCPPGEWIDNNQDCENNQVLMFASLCCSKNAAGEPQWQGQINMLCANERPFDCDFGDGAVGDKVTAVAGGGFLDEGDNWHGYVQYKGGCKPMNLLSIDAQMRTLHMAGGGIDGGPLRYQYCPVTVTFRPLGGGNAMLFDPGGRNLVDSGGMQLS